jgi:hypothetical protein
MWVMEIRNALQPPMLHDALFSIGSKGKDGFDDDAMAQARDRDDFLVCAGRNFLAK